MISNKNLDRISLICHAVVSHMFADFCNPKYRGPNFKWERFPEMMEDLCEDQVFLEYISGGDKGAIKEHARATGKRIAMNMVNSSGFVDLKCS